MRHPIASIYSLGLPPSLSRSNSALWNSLRSEKQGDCRGISIATVTFRKQVIFVVVDEFARVLALVDAP
jgi:hypothetical protein